MSGNGAPIPGTIIMMVRRQMAVLGQKIGMIIVLRCGAVLGAIGPDSCRSAYRNYRLPPRLPQRRRRISGGVGLLGGLCNPFSLFPVGHSYWWANQFAHRQFAQLAISTVL
jgi:hypothetical protein